MVWANASGQSMPEFVCVPGTDPSGGVGRDVGALHQESRFVPSLRSTGKSLLHDEASVRPSRRVATIARHDGIEEVLAPIDVSAAASRAPTKEAMSATTEGADYPRRCRRILARPHDDLSLFDVFEGYWRLWPL